MQIDECADMPALQEMMAAGDADFALVPSPCEAELAAWLLDDETIHVIAQTPLLGSDAMPPVWMLGRHPADQVGDETSIIAHDSGSAAQIVTRGARRRDLAGRHRDWHHCQRRTERLEAWHDCYLRQNRHYRRRSRGVDCLARAVPALPLKLSAVMPILL